MRYLLLPLRYLMVMIPVVLLILLSVSLASSEDARWYEVVLGWSGIWWACDFYRWAHPFIWRKSDWKQSPAYAENCSRCGDDLGYFEAPGGICTNCLAKRIAGNLEG